jgi:hypothetical protein
MRSSTELGPLGKLGVLLATAVVAILLMARGPFEFMRLLIIVVPSIIGLVALCHFARRLSQGFREPEEPWIPAGRSLRLRKKYSSTSQSQAHWTVCKDDFENEEPFQPETEAPSAQR